MKRRKFMLSMAGAGLASNASGAVSGEKWGAQSGFASGWGEPPGMSRHPHLRVGNNSGGLEKMLRTRTIRCATPTPLTAAPRELKFRHGLFTRTAHDYVRDWPVTGLLIARRSEVWLEAYQFGRTADMRLTSWSMAKSVTSLLLGVCVDRKQVISLEDTAASYVKGLAGTLHGETTLRNLLNMSSGADVQHEQAGRTIYATALTNRDSSVLATLRQANTRREEQGRRFNYNELCALTIGAVIRAAAGVSLSELAQEALWQPMGAEGDATWLTDSEGAEFNCVGYAARLRDWARLGLLFAGRGRVGGRQVVSSAWIDSYTQWTQADGQVRYGALPGRERDRLRGYKFFVWHAKADGSQPVFFGAQGQVLMMDMPTGTVLVQTAVDDAGDWFQELYALFQAATEVQS